MSERCAWAGKKDTLMISYHDHEWGRPVYDDKQLFAKLCLDGAQAGLSWRTILHKQANYYAAFDDFDAEKIACYDEYKRVELLQNTGIVRNKLKINGFIYNAQAYLAIIERQPFHEYLWQLAGSEVKINHWQFMQEVPTQTAVSEGMSKQLKKDGFHFVGPTICYAFMQAVGMVNDHLTNCFCHPDYEKNDYK